MLNRLSVNALLKSTIGVLAAIVIMFLGYGAFNSWQQFSSASRLVRVASASSNLFKGLHNLRLDRSTTSRDLLADKPLPPNPALQEIRANELPALKAGLAVLREIDFPESQNAVAALDQVLTKLQALHQETNAAFALPKAARPAGLAQEVSRQIGSLLDLLEKISGNLANATRLADSYVDQLMQIKQLAWVVRNIGGDASVMSSNMMAGMPIPPDAMTQFYRHMSSAETAFGLLESLIVGLPLPARLVEAVQVAKREFFSPDYSDVRIAMMKTLVSGGKPEVSVTDWVKTSVSKLATLLNVAEISLEIVAEHAVERRANAQWKVLLQLASLIAALACSCAIMILISRRVTAPLLMIRETMLKLANGDFNVALPQLKSRDEVGQIVGSVNTMVKQIRSTISGIKTSAREVTNASAEIATTTTDLSQRTEEQAASLEETSASMEEISSTVKKNAENARHASSSAGATKDVADRGGQVVAQAVNAMAKIEESSRKISDIIGVIDEIARQTNLLALNAAVEAARAGEAGRGFAVVASEVRSLAQRSSQAAKDIKDLITNSNGQVKDGVDLVNRAGVALTEIVESIKTVADIVAGIATASAEQSTGIDEINKALTQMDGVTQQNSALVEENAATAKTLEFQAKSMDEQVAFFQVDGNSITAGQPNRSHDSAPAPRRTAARHARAA